LVCANLNLYINRTLLLPSDTNTSIPGVPTQYYAIRRKTEMATAHICYSSHHYRYKTAW
jgi:hypothetical protein